MLAVEFEKGEARLGKRSVGWANEGDGSKESKTALKGGRYLDEFDTMSSRVRIGWMDGLCARVELGRGVSRLSGTLTS